MRDNAETLIQIVEMIYEHWKKSEIDMSFGEYLGIRMAEVPDCSLV